MSPKVGHAETISIPAMDRACEPEVSKFQVEIFVKKQILRLEISMSDTIRVAIVYRDKNLLKVIPCLPLRDRPSLRNEVE